MSASDPPSERNAVETARQQFEARRPDGFSRALDASKDSREPEVPGYTLEREIHRGGQGAVYRAVQHATGQVVAVKLLYEGPRGFASDRVRFDREIAILSQLRHRNIVGVHDAGSAGGRLFYVMDYVEGETLDRVTRTLNLNELLVLFAKICEAVNIAHLRGVIHRDLKPANILIDRLHEPHIVDFGLAKLGRDDPLLNSSAKAMTATGQFVGSLPWSSPEQLSQEHEDIDTRVDVYALGVIFYYALTGQFPYPVTGSALDLIECIRSHEPIRPRAALQLSRDASRIDPAAGSSVSPAIRLNDEIETIVLKCLQKDRERRYQTAGELARDLNHHLANEPIEAKRDSLTYVLRKHLRRHRLPVFAALSFLALIVAALLTTFFLWRRAEDRQAQAEAESARATAAETTSEKRRIEVVQHLEEALAVTSVLESIFGGSAETHDFRGREYTVKQMLDERSEPVLAQLAGRPELEIRIRTFLATAYRTLGEFERATAHAEAAVERTRQVVGPASDEHGDAFRLLGMVRLSAGEPARAEALFRQALEIHERSGNVSAQWNDRFSLAGLLLQRGESEAAGSLIPVQPGEELPEGLTFDQQVEVHRLAATLLQGRRDLAGAEREYRAALTILEGQVAADDSRFPMLRNDLAMVLHAGGDSAGARPLLESAAQSYARLYGEESPRYATTLSNLGLIVNALGDREAAEQTMRRALDIRRRVLPEMHPDVAAALNNLAYVLEARKKFDEALPLYREALQLLESRLGMMHPHTIICTQSLGRTLQAAGQLSEALSVGTALAERQRSANASAPEFASTLAMIGWTLNDMQAFDRAEPALRECLAIRETCLPADSWLIANTRSLLGEAIAGQGRIAEAEPILAAALDSLQQNARTPPERVEQAAARLDRWRQKPNRNY